MTECKTLIPAIAILAGVGVVAYVMSRPVVPAAITEVLNRTRVRIQIEDGSTVDRDIRDAPYSDGLKVYPKSIHGWIPAVIRCDDVSRPENIDGKTDIYYPMFYSEGFNPDWISNGFPADHSVVVVDCCLAGVFLKDIVIDGVVVASYAPGGKAFHWIHYDMVDGNVWVG